MGPPVWPYQSGVQTAAAQPTTPAASKAYNFPSSDPTYTTLARTVGEECTAPAVVAVHRGEQLAPPVAQPTAKA